MPPSELPPDDFDDRPLPIEIIASGAVLYRSHRAEHDPIYFSIGHTLNRFDDPVGEFGVCYCSKSPQGAFAETFLRQRTGGFVDPNELGIRALATLEVLAPDLRLVPCYGAGLTKLGATAAVTAGSVAAAQQWASAIHHHPNAPDGVLYRVRHDNDQIGVALFERSASSLGWLQSELWRHIDLDAICKRYGLVL